MKKLLSTLILTLTTLTGLAQQTRAYGVPVYQEQVFDPELALKGHYGARTMLSVEALWHRRFKTSLR